MDEQTQNEIAQGLRRGESAAWQRLYDAYATRVWREVARLVGDRSAVADVVQETFLEAALSAGGFDPRRGTLWAWLWGVARNQVAYHYRRQTRCDALQRARQWWSTLDGRTRAWAVGEDRPPEEALASRELAVLVRATLAELRADYQMLLAAKYLDGEPVERIAGELGCSGEAVRSKLARARRAFRRAFSRLTRPTTGR